MEKEIEKKEPEKMDTKKLVFIIISALVLILLGFLVFKFSPNKTTKALSMDEAKIKTEKFINENLMMPGTKANIVEIVEEYGLYKISVDVGTEEELIESYISKDGLLFFPQSIDIQEYEDLYKQEGQESSEILNKQDILDIELFVMSHCPYGTQMEKALFPAISALGSNVNFQLKFNTYAMHDKVELDEQLTQYCIQKEEKEKLLTYLNCFNQSGESEPCLNSASINKNIITSCVNSTDAEYKITENYNNTETWLQGTYPTFPIYQEDNEKYNVQGSPTLIVNGEEVSSERTPYDILQMLCSGFINPPSECLSELSTTSPEFGFGE